MSLEDSSSAENIDETQLLKDDDNDMANADAVSLFNASLSQALQRQKSEILSEFQKTLSSKTHSLVEQVEYSFDSCNYEYAVEKSSVKNKLRNHANFW